MLAEDGVAAEGALAVPDHRLEALDGRLGPLLLALRLGGAQLLLQEERHGLPLLPRVVHPAVRLLAVPPSPPGLLVVAGDALGGNSMETVSIEFCLCGEKRLEIWKRFHTIGKIKYRDGQ